jgi:hypothetical protein
MIQTEVEERKADFEEERCGMVRVESVVVESQSTSIFDALYRYRLVALTSPLWFGAILILLNNYGSPEIRAVIQFMTASPLR